MKGSGEAIMTTRFNAMFDETNMKHLEVFVTDSVFYINPPKHIQAATQAQRETRTCKCTHTHAQARTHVYHCVGRTTSSPLSSNHEGLAHASPAPDARNPTMRTQLC